MPQALTWNMGTTSSAVSAEDRLNPSDVQVAIECSKVERWEYNTPFGFPVVPEV
ncbi:hypothetical protein D3C87_1750040 [compost metagenome]